MLALPPVEESIELNTFPVLFWNHVGLQMNRITHSLGGPQGGPTMSSRALGLLHLAMHDAFFGILGKTESSTPPMYLPDSVRPAVPVGTANVAEANVALTAAAITTLDLLYGNVGPGISILARDTLSRTLSQMIADYQPQIDALRPSYTYGAAIAREIGARLAVKAGEIGADQGRYEPKHGRFQFRDEPVLPLRRVAIDPDDASRGTRPQRTYHGPFYGTTVATFAVTDPNGHKLAEWPASDYTDALREVAAVGGAAERHGTTRTPDETVAGLFWAYDGANLIGTPPRLYNQILRTIAWQLRDTTANPDSEAQNAEFVRLFALANTAMADAGKFAWAEKFKFELWRPLSGIREHDTGGSAINPDGNTSLEPDADPFWTALGAPETNSNRVAFKPPFPAYPSGHATFGAACFQMMRHFYKDRDSLGFDDNGVDAIGFSFVSEELNGISRDLRQDYDPSLPIDEQPGVIRTRVKRRFSSLWHAIFENAYSRIYLGVHWRFDAACASDIKKADGSNKDPADISYQNVWTGPRVAGDPLPIGGIPLGLGIANDIWINGMRSPDAAPALAATASLAPKHSNTTYA